MQLRWRFNAATADLLQSSLALYCSPDGVRMNQAAPVASPLPLNEKRGKKKEEDEKWNERRREHPRG